VGHALRARDRDGGVVAVLYLDVDDFSRSTTTKPRSTDGAGAFSVLARGGCGGIGA
jgi:hypothetical protein